MSKLRSAAEIAGVVISGVMLTIDVVKLVQKHIIHIPYGNIEE